MRLPDEDEKEFGKPQDSLVLSVPMLGTIRKKRAM